MVKMETLETKLSSLSIPADKPIETFKYDHLDKSSEQIRLIRAVTQPEKLDETATVQEESDLPVVDEEHQPTPDIQIMTFPIAQAPAFTALSYVWGSNSRSESIICSGKPLAVTASLKALLRRLTIQPGWFWVDGICINQGNIPEKNSQVQLMSQIYRTAKGVVCFVGDPPGNEGLEVWYALEALNSALDKATLPESNLTKMIVRFNIFQSSAWFSRGWIIQEAAMNGNCILWYGNMDIPFSHLGSVVQLMQDKSGHYALLNKGFAPGEEPSADADISEIDQMQHFRQIDSINRLRSYTRLGKLMPLCRPLSLGRSSGFTDARDKIYAFLGFMSKDMQQSIRPNYAATNSVEAVYTQFATAGVNNGDGIDVLSYAGLSDNELPSWVPDWESYQRNAFASSIYRCSLDSRPTLRIDSNNGKVLIARGALIDEIRFVHMPRACPLYVSTTPQVQQKTFDSSPMPESMPESQRPFWTTLMQDAALCMLGAQLTPYPTGENIRDVVWRTAIADSALASIGYERADPAVDGLNAAAFSHLYRPKGRLPPAFNVQCDETDKDELFRLADAYHQQVDYTQSGRRMGVTKKMYMAVFPDTAAVGDFVAIVLGAPMPFVVRKMDKWYYRLLGEAYVHGIMDGELMSRNEGASEMEYTVKGAELQDFKIM